jgi:hypothetical protein
MTKNELITYYEERLKKAQKEYTNDWRKKSYVERAEKDLEEVKNGRKW